MSSYIIAGSADNIDTAYCQQIARRIKAKYKNIDFRIVIKHPSQWQQYLQQICRIYGFLKKSNPIIYTFDGKIIGNKQSFMSTTAKYFGLDQQTLNVQNLKNQVNMKIATQQINRKNRSKNNIKTLNEKIQIHYNKLLKSNNLKQQLKQKKEYLINGISYIHRNIKGIAPTISFVKNKQIKVQVQQIQCSDIDLLAVSLNDQIKVQQTTPIINTVGKQAFVTMNQKNNSQHDKMSQASKTNKMHQSIVSYDKQSKQMKQSSKSKLRIDQQNDDCPDYIDYAMSQMIITQLADQFYVAFNKNSYISGEMVFYHNQDSNGNCLRMYNDNRPVNGHRVLIKEVYYDGQKVNIQDQNQIQRELGNDQGGVTVKNLQQINQIKTQKATQLKSQKQIQSKLNQHKQEQIKLEKPKQQEKKLQEKKQQNKQQEKKEQEKKEQHKEQNKIGQNTEGNTPEGESLLNNNVSMEMENNQIIKQPIINHAKPKVQIQKSKTQPNISQVRLNTKNNLLQNSNNDDDILSQIDSDLNLISNLNYHTLFVQKPLSSMQLKNLLYFINDTDCIGCLQFLPQSPNPKFKLYYRKLLLSENLQHSTSSSEGMNNNLRILLPVQKFIQKQIQDQQFQKFQIPNEKCYDYDNLENQVRYQLITVNDLGYEHYIYQLNNDSNEQIIGKVIKHSIDAMLSLQEQLKRDIGYNLIITKKYIILVPLAQTYEIYNETKLYLDGLAYLGFVHLAQLVKPYQLKDSKIRNMGTYIRSLLAKCANGKTFVQ